MLENKIRIAEKVLLWVTCLAVLVAAIVFIVMALSRPSDAAELVLGPSPKPHPGTASVTITLPKPRVRVLARVVAAPPVPQYVRPTKLPAAPKPPEPPVGGGYVALGQRMAAARGWTGSEWDALYELWNHESGWSPNNYGPWIHGARACGIPQRYPCGGLDAWSPAAQITWGLDYIAGRYGRPSVAWGGWYARGSSY